MTTARLDWGARLTILAALLLAGLALASNLVLLAALLRVQDAAVAGLDNAVAQMEGLCGPGTEPILFPISQTIRFKGDVAMPDNLVIPFKGNIPIKTTVRISIPGLPGGPTIEVPINTVVPVDTQVALPGGMRIPIDTQVPVRQVMPIDLCAPDSPVHGFLGQAIQELRTLRQSLSFP